MLSPPCHQKGKTLGEASSHVRMDPDKGFCCQCPPPPPRQIKRRKKSVSSFSLEEMEEKRNPFRQGKKTTACERFFSLVFPLSGHKHMAKPSVEIPRSVDLVQTYLAY
jgi:hypothetical protein